MKLERLILWPGLIGALLFCAGPALAHLGWVPPLKGFRLMAFGALLAAAVALAAVLAAAAAALRAGNPLPAFKAGLPAVAVTLLFYHLYSQAKKHPPINDFTTTPGDPPRFAGGADYPPSFAEIQKRSDPDLAPLQTALSPDAAYAKALEAARAEPGWTISSSDPGSRRIQAVAESELFRFKDDVVVEVRPGSGGAQVHVRSKSRDGKGDIGANAKRIREYLGRVRG